MIPGVSLRYTPGYEPLASLGRSTFQVVLRCDFYHGFSQNWARIFTILCLSVLCFVLICGYFGVVAVRRVCAAVIGGGAGGLFLHIF